MKKIRFFPLAISTCIGTLFSYQNYFLNFSLSSISNKHGSNIISNSQSTSHTLQNPTQSSANTTETKSSIGKYKSDFLISFSAGLGVGYSFNQDVLTINDKLASRWVTSGNDSELLRGLSGSFYLSSQESYDDVIKCLSIEVRPGYKRTSLSLQYSLENTISSLRVCKTTRYSDVAYFEYVLTSHKIVMLLNYSFPISENWFFSPGVGASYSFGTLKASMRFEKSKLTSAVNNFSIVAPTAVADLRFDRIQSIGILSFILRGEYSKDIFAENESVYLINAQDAPLAIRYSSIKFLISYGIKI